MAGSTTTQKQQKVNAATTAVHIRVTIKEMVAARKLATAAASGREIVGAVTGCDSEGGKVSCVMETLQCDSEV